MSLSNEEAEFVSFASLCQAVTSRSDAEPNESEGGHPTPRRSDRIRFLDKLSQLLATEKGDVVACALHVDRKNSPTIYVASTRAIATVKPLAEFVFAECQAAANHERSLAESRNRIKEEVIPRSVEVLSTRMKRPHGRRALESMDLQSIRVSLIAAKAEILERVNARLHKVRAIKRTDQLFVKRTGGGKPIDVIGENFEVFVDDYIIYIRQLQELLPTLHESPQADLFLLVQIGLIAARLYESAAFPSLAKLVSEPKFSKFIRKSAQCEIAITTFTNHLTKKGIKHFVSNATLRVLETKEVRGCLRPWEEIARQYGASDEMVTLMRADPTKYGIDRHPSGEVVVPVHAAIQIIHNFEHHHPTTRSISIGMSKYCCFLCRSTFRIWRYSGKTIHVSGSHGKVNGLWRDPGLGVLNRLSEDLKDLWHTFLRNNDPVHVRSDHDSDDWFLPSPM